MVSRRRRGCQSSLVRVLAHPPCQDRSSLVGHRLDSLRRCRLTARMVPDFLFEDVSGNARTPPTADPLATRQDQADIHTLRQSEAKVAPRRGGLDGYRYMTWE